MAAIPTTKAGFVRRLFDYLWNGKRVDPLTLNFPRRHLWMSVVFWFCTLMPLLVLVLIISLVSYAHDLFGLRDIWAVTASLSWLFFPVVAAIAGLLLMASVLFAFEGPRVSKREIE